MNKFFILFLFTILLSSGYSVNVNSCSELNQDNTTYDLINSFVATTDKCINISATNITFDGHGFIMSGNSGVDGIGLNVTGSSNTIKNLGINNFETSIYISTTAIYTMIQNNTIGNVLGASSPSRPVYGIIITGDNSSIISNILTNMSSGTTIANNDAYSSSQNATAIIVYSDKNNISNNIIQNIHSYDGYDYPVNNNVGLYLGGFSGNVSGVILKGANNSVISNNMSNIYSGLGGTGGTRSDSPPYAMPGGSSGNVYGITSLTVQNIIANNSINNIYSKHGGIGGCYYRGAGCYFGLNAVNGGSSGNVTGYNFLNQVSMFYNNTILNASSEYGAMSSDISATSGSAGSVFGLKTNFTNNISYLLVNNLTCGKGGDATTTAGHGGNCSGLYLINISSIDVSYTIIDNINGGIMGVGSTNGTNGTSYGIHLFNSSNISFINNSNKISYLNTNQSFWSNYSQNTGNSKGNIGWWPLLDADGSTANTMYNTAYYNSTTGYNGSLALDIYNLYWFNNSYDGIVTSTISICQTLNITGVQRYVIVSNITSNSTVCMSIPTNNVILDCQNNIIFNVNLSPSTGILSTGTNVTIENCKLQGFRKSINLANVNSNTLENNSITNIYYTNTNSSNVNGATTFAIINNNSNNTYVNNLNISNITGEYGYNTSTVGVSAGYGGDIYLIQNTGSNLTINNLNANSIKAGNGGNGKSNTDESIGSPAGILFGVYSFTNINLTNSIFDNIGNASSGTGGSGPNPQNGGSSSPIYAIYLNNATNNFIYNVSFKNFFGNIGGNAGDCGGYICGGVCYGLNGQNGGNVFILYSNTSASNSFDTINISNIQNGLPGNGGSGFCGGTNGASGALGNIQNIYMNRSSNNLFLRVNNSLDYINNSYARFYSDVIQSSLSINNLGWWPILTSLGSDTANQSMTQYYNITDGKNADLTLNSSLKYWFNNSNNQAPMISKIEITPILYRNSTLSCNVTAIDNDTESLNITQAFYRNGTVFSTTSYIATNNTEYATTMVLENATTTKGDNWSCSAYAYDNFTLSEINYTINITVSNSPPSQPQIAFDLGDFKNDSFNSTCQNSTDLDNDTIYYYYEYSSNTTGTILQVFEQNNTYLNCLTNSACNKTDNIRARCLASDMFDNSTSSSYDSKKIQNSPPSIPILAYPDGGQSFTVGQDVNIQWNESVDTDGDILYYWIYYSSQSSNSSIDYVYITNVVGANYHWINAGLTTSTDYKVRLYANDSENISNNDTSMNTFSFTSSGTIIINPGGGGSSPPFQSQNQTFAPSTYLGSNPAVGKMIQDIVKAFGSLADKLKQTISIANISLGFYIIIILILSIYGGYEFIINKNRAATPTLSLIISSIMISIFIVGKL